MKLLLFLLLLVCLFLIMTLAPTRETFVSLPPKCPPNYKMYIYGDTAYCCKGTINKDALSSNKSCIPSVTDVNAFCTLSVSEPGIPNCSKIHGSLLSTKGKTMCPPSKPNFCSSNRCCASPVTDDGTDCVNKNAGTFCDFNSDIFNGAPCQYQRMKELDTCPAGTNITDTVVASGPLKGMTIYGCSTLTSTCYTSTLINALKGLGKDVSKLTPCTSEECYVNGVKLGTWGMGGPDGNIPMILYTKEECDSLKGRYISHSKQCVNNESLSFSDICK